MFQRMRQLQGSQGKGQHLGQIVCEEGRKKKIEGIPIANSSSRAGQAKQMVDNLLLGLDAHDSRKWETG